MIKHLCIVGCMLSMSGVASAQEPQQPNSEITLHLTLKELNVVSDGLQTQPLGVALPVLNKLRSQYIDAMKPKEASDKKSEEKKDGPTQVK